MKCFAHQQSSLRLDPITFQTPLSRLCLIFAFYAPFFLTMGADNTEPSSYSRSTRPSGPTAAGMYWYLVVPPQFGFAYLIVHLYYRSHCISAMCVGHALTEEDLSDAENRGLYLCVSFQGERTCYHYNGKGLIGQSSISSCLHFQIFNC